MPKDLDVAAFDIDDIVQSLQTVAPAMARVQKRSLEPGGRELHRARGSGKYRRDLEGVLFPMRLGPHDLRQESENFYVGHALDSALHALFAPGATRTAIPRSSSARDDENIGRACSVAVRAFAARLPEIRTLLIANVLPAYHGDPAAGSVTRCAFVPGVLHVHHRLAHELLQTDLGCFGLWLNWRTAQAGRTIHPGVGSARNFLSIMGRAW